MLTNKELFADDKIMALNGESAGLTIEVLGELALAIEAKVLEKQAAQSDPNAPWLTEVHALCTDHGIPQGQITERIQALREKLAAQPVEHRAFTEFDFGQEYESATSGIDWNGDNPTWWVVKKVIESINRQLKAAQPVPKGYVKASETIDATRIYAALDDIWREANAVDTVLGDQDRLMRKVAKLRDEVGTAANCTIPLKVAPPVDPVCVVGSHWNSGGGFDVHSFKAQPPYGTALYTTQPDTAAELERLRETTARDTDLLERQGGEIRKLRGAVGMAVAALERFHLWADSQADAQSKGGHATFDIMQLREERDACHAAIATLNEAQKQSPTSADTSQTAIETVAHTKAARDVLAERQRQISVEGWTPEHDDEHDDGEIAAAASAYALAAADKLHPLSMGDCCFDAEPPSVWPWALEWWKPGEARRMMVKFCALGLAAIESMDRAAAREQEGGAE